MDPSTLIDAAVPLLPGQLLGAVLASLATVLFGAMLATGRRVAAPLMALAVVAVPLLGAWTVMARLGDLGADPSASVAAVVGVRLGGAMFALPPVALALLFGAGLGAAKGPRRLWAAGLVGVLVVVGAGALVAGGVVNTQWEFPAVRAVLYVGLGILLAAAACAGGQPGSPEASAAAGVAYAAAVGVGEAAGRALTEGLLLLRLPSVAADARAAFVERGVREVLGIDVPWAWAVIGLAVAAGGLAVLSGALRADGRRRAVVASSVLLLGVGPLVYGLGAVDRAVLDAVAAALP